MGGLEASLRGVEQQDLEDLLLALEVAVDRGAADAGFGADVVHAGRVVAALVEQLHRRGEDLVSPVRPALRAGGHLASRSQVSPFSTAARSSTLRVRNVPCVFGSASTSST